MLKPIVLSVLGCLLLAGQAKDISGTWIVKTQTPMGEMETVYRLKVDGGKISGSMSAPFGDSPIVEGKLDGDKFEFTVEQEFFGNLQKRIYKGEIAGDELRITPVNPPGGPGMGPRGPGMGPGGPGGPPPGGGGFRMNGPQVARRGAPTPSFRAPSVDYKTLPKVELPAEMKELPWNGLAKTPPMGWNSWNKFHTNINDRTVREIADAIVSTGMKDAGYLYINIDDGWQGKRDDHDVLQPNPNFPGMKALADYVHSKGLKIGIYSSPGPRTCGGYEGSYGHEDTDARTWASWGIDYLKYDWCSASRIWKEDDMRPAYQLMAVAIQKAGRPMVYSLCQYGRAGVQEWGPKVAGNLWRTTGDIRDQWESMANIGFSQSELAPYAAPGHWNDPDMLEVGNGRMTPVEYRTHISLWAMLAAPLIAGNDLRSMDSDTREILTNKEVIAVDQDSLGKAATRLSKSGETEVWARPLAGGAYAVALFNRSAEPVEVSVQWGELKLNGKRRVRDLWAHSARESTEDGFRASVPAHGTVMIRVE